MMMIVIGGTEVRVYSITIRYYLEQDNNNTSIVIVSKLVIYIYSICACVGARKCR